MLDVVLVSGIAAARSLGLAPHVGLVAGQGPCGARLHPKSLALVEPNVSVGTARSLCAPSLHKHGKLTGAVMPSSPSNPMSTSPACFEAISISFWSTYPPDDLSKARRELGSARGLGARGRGRSPARVGCKWLGLAGAPRGPSAVSDSMPCPLERGAILGKQLEARRAPFKRVPYPRPMVAHCCNA